MLSSTNICTEVMEITAVHSFFVPMKPPHEQVMSKFPKLVVHVISTFCCSQPRLVFDFSHVSFSHSHFLPPCFNLSFSPSRLLPLSYIT